MCENVRESMNYGKKEATKNKKKEKKGDNRTCKLLYIQYKTAVAVGDYGKKRSTKNQKKKQKQGLLQYKTKLSNFDCGIVANG